jgi:hypothetical protein
LRRSHVQAAREQEPYLSQKIHKAAFGYGALEAHMEFYNVEDDLDESRNIVIKE